MSRRTVAANADFREAIAERVRAARTARGWTYRDLEHYSGIAASHLHKLEHQQVDPSVRVAHAVAQTLGMTLHELCGLVEMDRTYQDLLADVEHYRSRLTEISRVVHDVYERPSGGRSYE